jgi:hypothetical protein
LITSTLTSQGWPCYHEDMEGHMKNLTERLVSFIDKKFPNNNLKKEYFTDISALLDDLAIEKIPFSIEGNIKVLDEKGKYSLVNFDISKNLGDIELKTSIVKNPISLPEYDLNFVVYIFLVKEQNVYFKDNLKRIQQKYPYLGIEEVRFPISFLSFLFSMSTLYKSKEVVLKFSKN